MELYKKQETAFIHESAAHKMKTKKSFYNFQQ